MYEKEMGMEWERLRNLGTVAGTVAENSFLIMLVLQLVILQLCIVRTKDGWPAEVDLLTE